MCYFFWGIREEPRPATKWIEADGIPAPRVLPPLTSAAPDWAWAEWVQEQGVGE